VERGFRKKRSDQTLLKSNKIINEDIRTECHVSTRIRNRINQEKKCPEQLDINVT